MVHQNSRLVQFLTVAENLNLAAELAGNLITEQEVERLLENVGLSGYANRLPTTLSGGQSHRVALARAIATGSRLLIVDEPTAALDRSSTHKISELLGDLASLLSISILVATHDPLLRDQADQVIDLNKYSCLNKST